MLTLEMKARKLRACPVKIQMLKSRSRSRRQVRRVEVKKAQSTICLGFENCDGHDLYYEDWMQ